MIESLQIQQNEECFSSKHRKKCENFRLQLSKKILLKTNFSATKPEKIVNEFSRDALGLAQMIERSISYAILGCSDYIFKVEAVTKGNKHVK